MFWQPRTGGKTTRYWWGKLEACLQDVLVVQLGTDLSQGLWMVARGQYEGGTKGQVGAQSWGKILIPEQCSDRISCFLKR